MAQLALYVKSMEGWSNELLIRWGLKKEKDKPLGTVDVVIDPETEEEQSFTLRPQEEAHLIPLKPGHHLVAVFDPDMEKHVEKSAKAGGIMSGLTGFALGAALGGSQKTMDMITKGTAKVVVGDVEKRWEKAFQKNSVKEFEIAEDETVSFDCWLEAEQGIAHIGKAPDRFWWIVILSLYCVLAVVSVVGVSLNLDLVLQGVLAAAGFVIVAIVAWKMKKKRNLRQNHGANK